MKINIKDYMEQFKKDGKYTPKSFIFIFMLAIICVQAAVIIYCNLFDLQYHLGFDASSAYLHAVEMWRDKSLVPDTFALTTTLGLDAPDALAALIYGITGNIFVSFGIANLIIDVIICIVFYNLLKEIGLTSFSRALGFVFFLCPFMTPDHFTDNNLSYFAMVFGEQASYSIKVTAMMLLLLAIFKLEHNKKCIPTIIFATLANMLTCISSGVYVAITILVPCIIYYLIKMLYENSYMVLISKGMIFSLVMLILSFMGKTISANIFTFDSPESNMLLTGIYDFWTNFGSLIMGYFQLFCGISIETAVSLFSLRGILQILSVGFILFMFILFVISVINGIKRLKEKEKNFDFVLPYVVIFVNIAVFVFSYTLYDEVFFEYRYLIIVYLMQILICCSVVDKLTEIHIFKNIIVTVLSAILLAETCGIFNYYHNDTFNQEVVYPLLEAVDELDVPVAYVWGEDISIDARNFRIIDLSMVYRCLNYNVYNDGANWGDYIYYDDNSRCTGKVVLISNMDEFSRLPEFISSKFEIYDFYGDFIIYIAENNPFDLTAWDNTSDTNINFMYSKGVNIDEEDLDTDGYYTADKDEDGDIFRMKLPDVEAGKYDITLEYEIVYDTESEEDDVDDESVENDEINITDSEEDMSFNFEAYKTDSELEEDDVIEDLGEKLAGSEIDIENTTVTLKDVELKEMADIVLKVDKTSGSLIKLKKVTTVKHN